MELYDRIPIEVINPASESGNPGILLIKQWKGKEATRRAFRLCFKILRYAVAPCLIAPFVHPLILPSLTVLSLTLLTMPFTFSYFRSQAATFDSAEGPCPHCPHVGRLDKYVLVTVAEQISLVCPACGQSCHARVPGWGDRP